MKARFLLRLVTLILFASAPCLTGCGTASGLGNAARGLGSTAWNLPRNLFRMGNQITRGVTQGVISNSRGAMGMGPRVLSVPAR
ncbi:MAG: hypothetical protein R3F19_02160 [Verrucomicrobiales bacterium]